MGAEDAIIIYSGSHKKQYKEVTSHSLGILEQSNCLGIELLKYFIGNFLRHDQKHLKQGRKNQSVIATLAKLGPVAVTFKIFVPTSVGRLRYGWL